MEEAGELVATEISERAPRMRCAHGEGGGAYARRRPRDGRIPACAGDGEFRESRYPAQTQRLILSDCNQSGPCKQRCNMGLASRQEQRK